MKRLLIAAILGFSFFLVGWTGSPNNDHNEMELIKLADYFGKYYQYVDEERMSEALADGFRYFTNVNCRYKDCDTGSGKADYIAGVIDERKTAGFKVESINMRYIAPLTVDSSAETHERKVSFYTTLVTIAKGKRYKLYSVMDYTFRKEKDGWKITKIDNRIIGR